jgi:hypothetical protein
MHKHPIASKLNSKADVTLQSFEDHLEQFRQSLINHNYANGTISPHNRFGARRDEMRRIFDTEGDWGKFLDAFARAAETEQG